MAKAVPVPKSDAPTPLAAKKTPSVKKKVAANPAASAKKGEVAKPEDPVTATTREAEYNSNLESYRKVKKYKGVTILENKKGINKVRAGVRPGKGLHDTLGKNRIYLSGAEDKWSNITETAWVHDMIMFVLSGIHNLPGRQEKLAHLKALKKTPPYYVLCELDATTESVLRDCQTLIQRMFRERENLS